MDTIESYQIKSKLDYFKLKDIAQEKLFKSSEIWTKQILEGLALIVGFIVFAVIILGIDDGFGLTNAILYPALVIMFYFALFGFLMIIKSIKKIRKSIEAYEWDLRRIQEKLTYSEIYMEIPKADKTEFKSVVHLVKISLKRMKKST